MFSMRKPLNRHYAKSPRINRTAVTVGRIAAESRPGAAPPPIRHRHPDPESTADKGADPRSSRISAPRHRVFIDSRSPPPHHQNKRHQLEHRFQEPPSNGPPEPADNARRGSADMTPETISATTTPGTASPNTTSEAMSRTTPDEQRHHGTGTNSQHHLRDEPRHHAGRTAGTTPHG